MISTLTGGTEESEEAGSGDDTLAVHSVRAVVSRSVRISLMRKLRDCGRGAKGRAESC